MHNFMSIDKRQKLLRRKKRVRSKIFGTAKNPRLSVFRSNKKIYGQLIDDEKGLTLVSANDYELAIKGKSEKKSKQSEKETVADSKLSKAFQVGELLAKKANAKKILKAVFDKGGYKYHGRVKALAEGARKGGLKF